MKRDLIIILVVLIIGVASKDPAWSNPPFTQPPGINFDRWNMNQDNSLFVHFKEEQEFVKIADVHCDDCGTDKPVIGKFLTGSNILLGAEIVEENGIYSLVVTQKQDYEQAEQRKYYFKLGLNNPNEKELEITLEIIDIDDTPPTITVVDDTCVIPENYEGKSNCTYIVEDSDSEVGNTDFFIPSPYDKNFKVVLKSRENKHKATFKLEVINKLDFETMPMYYFPLTAIDESDNKKTTQVLINVKDMPDMPPVWKKFFTTMNFKEESEKQEVTILAEDGDIGINDPVQYKIESSEGGDCFGGQISVRQNLNSREGVITIGKIDRDDPEIPDNTIQCTLIAYEPDPYYETPMNLIFIVQDINDNHPVIKLLHKKEIILNEAEFSSIDEVFSVTDIDQGQNAQFDVSFKESEFSKAFQIIPSSGYRNWDFSVSVLDPTLLDYDIEKWRSFEITIHSTDHGDVPLVYDQVLKIKLNNMNNKVPYFVTKDFTAMINETAKKDTKIIHIHAKDDDSYDYVTYTLTMGKDKFYTKDEPDNSTIIYTKEDNVFDYERQEEVIIQINVKDNLEDSKKNVHSISQQITITVIDANDEKPRITLPTDNPEIEENTPKGVELKNTVTAIDVDTSAELEFRINWGESYAVKDGSRFKDQSLYKDVFKIVTTYEKDDEGKEKMGYAIGTLVVEESQLLDYEIFESLYLRIEVEDFKQEVNNGTDAATLAIMIFDVNDNAPIFTNASLDSEKSVDENAPPGTIIGSLLAIDIDGPGNNEVSYYLKAVNNTVEGMVKIEEKTGVLRVDSGKQINADKNIADNTPETLYLYYNVIASDSELESTKQIEIFVKDLNDEFPQLEVPIKDVIEVIEGVNTNTSLQTICGIDYDRDDPHNKITYELNLASEPNNWKLFRVDQFTGEVFADGFFEWSASKETIEVEFILRDNYKGGSPNTFPTKFKAKIIDINNQPPILQDTWVVNRTITENEKGFVAKIEATDADKPCTKATEINYRILSITNDKKDEITKQIFKIENKHDDDNTVCSYYAYLLINDSLETYFGNIQVCIIAENIDAVHLNDTKCYTINIQPYNFKTPSIIFPEQDEAIILRETQKINSELIKITTGKLDNFLATDNQEDKFTMNFETVPGKWDDIFYIKNIGENKAQLLLKQLPTESKYTLAVKAYHDGTGSAQSSIETTFTVHFIDENEIPTFHETNITVQIYEENEVQICEPFPEAIDFKCNGQSTDCSFTTYYYLMSSDELNNFSINKTMPELCTKIKLDRETRPFHYLEIIATNEPTRPHNTPDGYVPLVVTVEVLDVNDNPPSFESPIFSGGITETNKVGTVIVTLFATDPDTVDEGKLTYEIVKNSITVSDTSLDKVKNIAFEIENNHIISGFQPVSGMNGYFLFKVQVFDSDKLHSDTAEVKIYIIGDENKVTFTFINDIDSVKPQVRKIQVIFSNEIGYNCTVDEVYKKVDDSGNAMNNLTEILTHFIDDEKSEPVKKTVIDEKVANIQTFSTLKLSFSAINLDFQDMNEKNEEEVKDLEELLRTSLIVVSVVLGTLCIILFVAFILRTRSLNKRLESMTKNVFGSTKSDLNRLGTTAPGTNKHAIEANPVWSQDPQRSNNFDTISEDSGGSELIGIEDNPEFQYSNRRDSVNPVFQNMHNNNAFEDEEDDDIRSLPGSNRISSIL